MLQLNIKNAPQKYGKYSRGADRSKVTAYGGLAFMLSEFSIEIAKDLFNSKENFPVDLDLAWKWLGYNQKSDCLEKLQSNFEVDSDYFRQMPELPTASTPRPKHKYYMTVECFKLMGMMAGTEKGKEIRKYFLECEKIAKQQTRPLSPAEMLLVSAQQLVDHEKRLEAIESKTSELEDFVHQHDGEIDRIFNPNGHYYSVLGYACKLGKKVPIKQASDIGRKCSNYCRKNSIHSDKLTDPRFGTVGVYPESVIKMFLK